MLKDDEATDIKYLKNKYHHAYLKYNVKYSMKCISFKIACNEIFHEIRNIA